MKLLKKLGAVAAILLAAGGALAQGAYPEKPVRVVVTTVPGPLDAFARAVLTQVGKRLNQTFIVDNRAGAGGNVGAEIVAKAPADGYTLLFALDTTFTVNPSLYAKMPFDVAKDFAIISVPVTYGQVLAVNPADQGDHAEGIRRLRQVQEDHLRVRRQRLAQPPDDGGLPEHRGPGDGAHSLQGHRPVGDRRDGRAGRFPVRRRQRRAAASQGGQAARDRLVRQPALAAAARSAHGRRVRLPQLQRQLRLCAGGAGRQRLPRSSSCWRAKWRRRWKPRKCAT